MFGKSKGTRHSKTGGHWMPKTAPEVGLSPEQERVLEHDDLAELLAATNAKREARGKRALSQDDVQMANWAAEQQMRRGQSG